MIDRHSGRWPGGAGQGGPGRRTMPPPRATIELTRPRRVGLAERPRSASPTTCSPRSCATSWSCRSPISIGRRRCRTKQIGDVLVRHAERAPCDGAPTRHRRRVAVTTPAGALRVIVCGDLAGGALDRVRPCRADIRGAADYGVMSMLRLAATHAVVAVQPRVGHDRLARTRIERLPSLPHRLTQSNT